MISIRKLTTWERFRELLQPSRRRAREGRADNAIRWLVEHPEEPVIYPQ